MSNKVRTPVVKHRPKILWMMNRRGGGNKTTVACAIVDAHLDAEFPVSLAEIEQEARISRYYKDLIRYGFFPLNGASDEEVQVNPKILKDTWDDLAQFLSDEVTNGRSVVVDMGANADVALSHWLADGGGEALSELDAEIVFVVPISTDLQTLQGADASLRLVLAHLPGAKIVIALSAANGNQVISGDSAVVKDILDTHKDRDARAVSFPVCVSSLMKSAVAQKRRPMDVAQLDRDTFMADMGIEPTVKEKLRVGRNILAFKNWWLTEVAAAGVIIGSVPGEADGYALRPRASV